MSYTQYTYNNMIQNGTKPHRLKLKDKDYILSFHPELRAGKRTLEQELQIKCGAPQFPAEYLTDKTGWLPDQNAEGQEEGCTNFAQTKIARILGISPDVATPETAEAATHANASGGMGIVASFDAIISKLGWIKGRYIIQATGGLSFFDAGRLAQISGLPEQRAISTGTPWFESWERAARAGIRLMPMPTADELLQAHNNPNSLPWHDYVRDGWSPNFPGYNGQTLYRLSTWQGPIDYLYLDQATINVVMDLYGTVDVVGTNNEVRSPTTISIPDWFWSLWHSWVGIAY